MDIRKELITPHRYYLKCPYWMKPTRIVVHNTANDASAYNEIEYMKRNEREVSFHFAVDDKEVVQGIPLDRNAWHAGDGANGVGNRQGIAIEICYSRSGGERFEKSEKRAAQLVAYLLNQYGWSIDKVTKHQDYSGKYCPHRTLDLGWNRFIQMVRDELRNSDEGFIETNGLKMYKINKFHIDYFDKNKRTYEANSYMNGGFFAYFKSETGVPFTLPVANIVCDVHNMSDEAYKYLGKYINSNYKLIYGCNNNQVPEYKGKKVSTFVIPQNGQAYVEDMVAPPYDCKYAISGVPTIRNGNDVDYYNYVKLQGFDESCMYATWRNWLGIRKDGSIWIITGRTNTKNYIYGMEFFNKVKDFHFKDIICLDGGGSYYFRKDKKAKTTWGNRSVNNIITF